MKHIKIKDARIRNNRMLQEDQRIFYSKILRMKQLKGRVPKIEKIRGSGQESVKTTSKSHKENG